MSQQALHEISKDSNPFAMSPNKDSDVSLQQFNQTMSESSPTMPKPALIELMFSLDMHSPDRAQQDGAANTLTSE